MKKDKKTANFRIQTAGSCPEVSSIHTVALFDPKDGRVLHLHESITFAGAKAKTDAELKAEALDYAARLGCGVDGLKVLLAKDFQADAPFYVVDLKKKALKAVKPPKAK